MAPDQGNQGSSSSQGVPSNEGSQSHGFKSYAEYLKALGEFYPYEIAYDYFLDHLVRPRPLAISYEGSNVFEIPEVIRVIDGHCHVYHAPSPQSFDDYLAQSEAEELLQYQIVIVPMPLGYSGSAQVHIKMLVDTLGLRLDTPPSVWRQLLQGDQRDWLELRRGFYIPVVSDKSKPYYLRIGRHLLYIKKSSDRFSFSAGTQAREG